MNSLDKIGMLLHLNLALVHLDKDKLELVKHNIEQSLLMLEKSEDGVEEE